MLDDRQQAADQILEAIEYGLLPVEEIERRLRQIIDEELSGSLDTDYNKDKVEICCSLLQRICTDQEFDIDSHTKEIKAEIENNHNLYKRRKRNIIRVACTTAAIILIFIGLTAMNVISPIHWFTGESTEDEQQYVVKGYEINIDTIAHAIAEHIESAQLAISTTDYADIVSFVGFDPHFPREINQYSYFQFDAIVMPDHIMIACDYSEEHSTDSVILLSKSFYSDASSAYEQYEQDTAGEEMELCNHTVYRYQNSGKICYLWFENSTVSLLTFDSTLKNTEELSQLIIEGKE